MINCSVYRVFISFYSFLPFFPEYSFFFSFFFPQAWVSELWIVLWNSYTCQPYWSVDTERLLHPLLQRSSHHLLSPPVAVFLNFHFAAFLPRTCQDTHIHVHVRARSYTVLNTESFIDFIHWSSRMKHVNICTLSLSVNSRKIMNTSLFHFICLLLFFREHLFKALVTLISPLWCHDGGITLLVLCLLHSFWDPFLVTLFLSSSQYV